MMMAIFCRHKALKKYMLKVHNHLSLSFLHVGNAHVQKKKGEKQKQTNKQKNKNKNKNKQKTKTKKKPFLMLQKMIDTKVTPFSALVAVQIV